MLGYHTKKRTYAFLVATPSTHTSEQNQAKHNNNGDMKTTFSLNSAILLFLGQHDKDGGAQMTVTGGAQMTVTYQYNTSDLKAIQVRCDGSNSNSSGAAVTARTASVVTSRPMCIVEYYHQYCAVMYAFGSFENYPYFRPTKIQRV